MAWKIPSQYIRTAAEVATALGVIFLAAQLWLLKDEIRLNAASQLYEQMVEIDKLFLTDTLENGSKLRLLIYGNVSWEQLSKDGSEDQKFRDHMMAMAAAEMMMDFFAQAVQVLDAFPQKVQQDWHTYIRDIYKCSPAIQETYRTRLAWYQHEKMATVIEQAKSDLAQELALGEFQCGNINIPKGL